MVKYNQVRMANILIGSSNVARFYKAPDFPTYKTYILKKCTKFEIFQVQIGHLCPDNKEIIISVIENFLCDAVMGVTDQELTDGIWENTIKQFMRLIYDSAVALPDTKFALVPPILRPGHKWYTEDYDGICKFFNDGVKAMSMNNVTRLEPISMMSQQFEEDGVHLTESSGKLFVEMTLEKAETFFKAPVIELEFGGEMEVGGEVPAPTMDGVAGGRKSAPTVSRGLDDRVKTLEAKVVAMGADIESRRFFDSLVSARTREELDTIANKGKEDRLVITGLTNSVPMPLAFEQKKKWLYDMIGEVLNKIEPGVASKIVWANQGRNNNRQIPMAEVKMESREAALKIRKKFSEMKKAGNDNGRLYISNSVTLATRVRIDILKAMAKRNENEEEDWHVMQYTSRPVLRLRKKNSDQLPLTLTFAEALRRFGRGLREEDLEGAYKRAGRGFDGQLQQNFVVLHDRTNVPKELSGATFGSALGSSTGTPRKRQRSGEEGEREGGFRGRGRGRARGSGGGARRGKDRRIR